MPADIRSSGGCVFSDTSLAYDVFCSTHECALRPLTLSVLPPRARWFRLRLLATFFCVFAGLSIVAASPLAPFSRTPYPPLFALGVRIVL